MRALDIARNPSGVHYFASGSNRSGEVRGLRRAGLNVGISALEVTARATRDYPLTTGGVARCSVALPVFEELRALPREARVFVDSGAFSEVKFSAGGPPEVVKPMTEQDWARVIGFYMRVSGILGCQAYLVAPDRVGCQETTFARLRRFANALRQVSGPTLIGRSECRDGAWVLVPVQRGELDGATFYHRACEIMGIGDKAIPAIPMKKNATTHAELVAFVEAVRPRRIHLLGLGPKSRRWSKTIEAIRAIVPDAEILADSVMLRSLVGRTNGRGNGPRALTAAMDAVLAASPELERHEARARAIEALVTPEPPADEPDTCPACGDDWIFSVDDTIYGCDIRTGTGEQFLTWRPCCEGMRYEVESYGFEEAYGVELSRVVELIASGLEVVEILGDGDGTILAKLRTVDPAVHVGDGRAKSPKGWRGHIFADVTAHHRHHSAPQGHKFSIAVHNGLVRVGVAVIGRPVSRLLQKAEPGTLEVTRVATWGRSDLRRNASSKLYSAAGKRAKALGFSKLVTYTLESESGVSLRASGFVPTRRSSGGSWDREGRARTDKAPTSPKTRWERGLTKQARREVAERGAALEATEQKIDATEQKKADIRPTLVIVGVSQDAAGRVRETMDNTNEIHASRRPGAIRLDIAEVTDDQREWCAANRIELEETDLGCARFVLPVVGSDRDGAMVVGFDGTYGWVAYWRANDGTGGWQIQSTLRNALELAISRRDGSEAYLARKSAAA